MWDAWVLVVWCAVAGAARLDSPDLSLLILEDPASLPPRRITPKSVFVAPTFCSEGYRQDSLGRCVKVVRLNQAAQWDFFLQKLNAMYAEPSPRPDRSGPLRLPIPLQLPTTTTELPTTETSTLPESNDVPTTEMTTLTETETETESTTLWSTTGGRTTIEEVTTTAPVTSVFDSVSVRCKEGIGVSRIEDSPQIPLDCQETAAEQVRFPSSSSSSEGEPQRTRVRFPETPPFWWPASWEVKRYPTSYQRLHHYHRRRPQTDLYS